MLGLAEDVLKRLQKGGASEAKVVARAGQDLSVRVRLGARVQLLLGGAAAASIATDFRSDRVTVCATVGDVRAELRRIA